MAEKDRKNKDFHASKWRSPNSHRPKRAYDENTSEMTNDIVGKYAKYDEVQSSD